MCEEEQFHKLEKRVDSIEERLTSVESAMSEMRIETRDGFRDGREAMQNITVAVANLAHDFGSRMSVMELRIVTEKERWGETLRKILTWGAKALILGALVAMGINIVNSVIKSYFGGGG